MGLMMSGQKPPDLLVCEPGSTLFFFLAALDSILDATYLHIPFYFKRMAPPDVIDVASRPVRVAERTPTLRRKKSFPKVKVNSSCTPPVLVRPGPLSSISGLPADKISEIDQPAGLVWLFFSIEKESAVCASHLLLGSAGRSDLERFFFIDGDRSWYP
ncbi:hypothetical protein MTR67_039928 [Solanum verrucosum]|uniref:Uncharacterized protein n=1 Tax=Solanum verrucosum TaxID=315347 RepID=A0AAF0UJG6_SOLVR|nr:hypothetical protein MTR67_039928 [Solanum verrucosum]